MAREDINIVNGSAAGNFSGGFEWKITNSIEDAIERNATDIEVVMWGKMSSSYTSYDHSSKTSYYKLTVGGGTSETVNIKTKTDWDGKKTGTVYYAGDDYPLKVTSGNAVAKFTVSHNTDGTPPAVKIQTKWSADAGTFQGITASADIILPTIPRATTPVVSPTTQACGGNITIDLSSSASELFTHTLSYRLGSESGSIAAKTSSQSISWKIPESLAGEFLTVSRSQTLAIICDTYQGDNLIGSKQVYITATLPSSYAPDIVINSIANLSGQQRFLQGVDGIKVNFSVGLKNGATSVTSAVLTAGGLTYPLNNPQGTTSLTIASQIIPSGGSVPISLSVTDNRGMTKTASETVTFTAYTPPTITLYAKRDETNPAKVNITGKVTHSLAFTCYIDYRVKNTGSWATLAERSSSNNALEISEPTESMLQSQAWEVRARVVDKTYSLTTEKSAYVTAVVTYSEKRGGKAASFFGPATEVKDGTLKIFGNLEVSGEIAGLSFGGLEITDEATEGDGRPISSGGVFTIVGNIEALMKII